MRPLRCENLEPYPNLKKVLAEIENYILAHQGIDAFEEILKLLISKLYDEKINLELFPNHLPKYPMRDVAFRTYSEKEETFAKISELFENAKNTWPGIFSSDSLFDIKPHVMYNCVEKLQNITLTNSGLDSLGEAFESLINPRIKGEKGQYFTPPHVVRMAVHMINPKIHEKILDPACGSGAFLIETIKKIIVDESIDNKEEVVYKFVRENIYGIDFDQRLVKIARAYMIIYGSGENNIHLLDALDIASWSKEEKDCISNFDVIITNPPFAGKVTDPDILKNFRLSEMYYSKKGFPRKTTREILFLERCINLLKVGGRLAIVLPHGITNNKSLQYIREFLFEKGQLLAIVSFDENMFRPYTSAKTCLLLFKRTNGHEPGNYPIFLGVSEKSGKNSKGEYIFGKEMNQNTRLMKDGAEYYIDCDTHEISEKYRGLING